jgi:hypothetical protein
LTWDGMARCHLCGRSPGEPPRPPPRPRRENRRRDPDLELARKVLPPPAPAAVWDDAFQGFVIDETGG